MLFRRVRLSSRVRWEPSSTYPGSPDWVAGGGAAQAAVATITEPSGHDWVAGSAGAASGTAATVAIPYDSFRAYPSQLLFLLNSGEPPVARRAALA